MTLYKVRIMKKVAIVTADSLDSRSFIWDEVTNHFKAKINSLSINKVTQETDGLCVIGEGDTVVESFNNPFRRRFIDNVVDLPHFKMYLGSGEDSKLRIDFKNFVGVIDYFQVAANNSDGFRSYMYNVEANSSRIVDLGMNVRISYVYDSRIVVMEVLKAYDYGRDSEGFDQDSEGFVDVLINANVNDFNNLPIIDGPGLNIPPIIMA